VSLVRDVAFPLQWELSLYQQNKATFHITIDCHSELSIMVLLAPEERGFARGRFSITHLINLLLICVLKTATCDCDVIISFSNKCGENS
jgi:hypothetical protein